MNNIVETNVLPKLQQIAKVGTRIDFVGCVEVGDEDLDLKPLKLQTRRVAHVNQGQNLTGEIPFIRPQEW